MTPAELTSLITAAVALVGAVTALVRLLRHQRGPQHRIPPHH